MSIEISNYKPFINGNKNTFQGILPGLISIYRVYRMFYLHYHMTDKQLRHNKIVERYSP